MRSNADVIRLLKFSCALAAALRLATALAQADDQPPTAALVFHSPNQKASPKREWMIALGALQFTDCVTTRDVIRAGGYEENPIARAAGASSSLPLCLVESAAVDLTVARMGNTAVLVVSGLEGLAVQNNLRVLVQFGRR